MKQIIKILFFLISISSAYADVLNIYSNKHTDILSIKQKNNVVFVLGFGGAEASPIAADCAFKTFMSHKDEYLTGSLLNMDTDLISYDIQNSDMRKVLIEVHKDILTIKDINTFGLCGLGINFLGNYTKISPKDNNKFEKKLNTLLELLTEKEKIELLNVPLNLDKLYTQSLKEYKQKNYSLIKDLLLNDGIYRYLSLFPISKINMPKYNDIAYFLQEAKAYHESIYLLEKILEKFPNRTVAYLNLGDAYWGLENKGKAIEAYQTYIKQMKENGKEKKIPKVVLERVK